jgi:hypothetical protein
MLLQSLAPPTFAHPTPHSHARIPSGIPYGGFIVKQLENLCKKILLSAIAGGLTTLF